MDKRSNIKSGLIFGIAMTLGFFVENILKYDPLTTKTLFKSIVSALVGALAGFLFGWLMGLFTNSKLFTKGTKISLVSDENILFETGANHFKGAEAVGGKLYLTDKRLVFKSHKFNIQNHELSITLRDIDNVQRYKTAGLINNGLSVTVNNKTEKFVVQQIDEWLNLLAENKIAAQQ